MTHPTDITSSMQPILGNLDKKSRGGNDLIDVDAALEREISPPISNKYDERDVALYALGVGAAENPLDPKDLPLVYEMSGEGFHVLPTFAVIPAMRVIFEQFKKGEKASGLNYGFERILHGEQYTEVKRPLPPNAKLTHKTKIKDIFDKGKNAVVVTSITTTDENGEELAYNELTSFVRGAGGWGGDRGPERRRERRAGPQAGRGRRGEDAPEPGAPLSLLAATSTRSTPIRISRRASGSTNRSSTASARSASPRAR